MARFAGDNLTINTHIADTAPMPSPLYRILSPPRDEDDPSRQSGEIALRSGVVQPTVWSQQPIPAELHEEHLIDIKNNLRVYLEHPVVDIPESLHGTKGPKLIY
jgi:hypothetical protein